MDSAARLVHTGRLTTPQALSSTLISSGHEKKELNMRLKGHQCWVLEFRGKPRRHTKHNWTLPSHKQNCGTNRESRETKKQTPLDPKTSPIWGN